MADIQKYFVQFDEAIRFERDDEKAILVEKRERVLRRLSEGIKRQRQEGTEIPSYEAFNQGSYAMNIGVKPVNGDFDIDVGLRFDLSTADYPDPVVAKAWVHNALEKHTKKVVVRRSCVTVYYQEHGEDIYHVDLVVYSSGARNGDGKDYVAKGKLESSASERFWDLSNAQELQNLITSAHSGEDAQQFRRIVRALKRWKDLRFSSFGRAAPKGIALTVAAYHWLRLSKRHDAFANVTKYDDLEALSNLVAGMLSRFQPVWSDGEQQFVQRLSIALPISPHSDLCDNMSGASMRSFKERLEMLLAALRKAQEDVDPHTACKELREHLGEDFHVPEKSDTAQKRDRAIISSGNSA
ncbi:cyclic GMP-AMP synthase DncV-like nucleotidyltransferase [Sorangium sp. So ce1014]|uniref:cyclic GMP-AMP synthase DncV-like nucleotidyltransferase n=1 Tax=Sorangium sp. So ce1014 TaxID=3133326 RepID=UPI003F5D803D